MKFRALFEEKEYKAFLTDEDYKKSLKKVKKLFGTLDTVESDGGFWITGSKSDVYKFLINASLPNIKPEKAD